MGNYRFQPFQPNERELMIHVMTQVAQDEKLLADVDEFHAAKKRCAIVGDLLADDRTVEYLVADDEFIKERFTFPQVADALKDYDPAEELCVLVLRKNRDLAVLHTGRQDV